MSAKNPTRRNILKLPEASRPRWPWAPEASSGRPRRPPAAGDGFGLHIVDRNEADARMWYYRFQTGAIGWNPGVNVLLPDDYHWSGRRYPVLYLFHGGGTDQNFITFDREGIRAWTAACRSSSSCPTAGTRAGTPTP
ncbi:esterase [Streptomyces tanashiensis]